MQEDALYRHWAGTEAHSSKERLCSNTTYYKVMIEIKHLVKNFGPFGLIVDFNNQNCQIAVSLNSLACLPPKNPRWMIKRRHIVVFCIGRNSKYGDFSYLKMAQQDFKKEVKLSKYCIADISQSYGQKLSKFWLLLGNNY